MLKNEFEEILLTESPYYKKLQHSYREVSSYQRYITVLKKISRNDRQLEYFEKKEGKDLVFLGRKILSLQEDFIVSYLDFLKNQANVNKWEEFFERYSNSLFEIYKRFTDGNANRIFIFEIVNRKLLRDLLTKFTLNKTIDEKTIIAERIGHVLNQLFNYVRQSLARNVVISDAMIVESYGKIPFLPKCSRSETMKIMGKMILRRGIPEPLFNSVIKSLITAYYTDEMNNVIGDLDKLGSSFTKENIVEILNAHFFFPDDKSLEQLLGSIKTKAEKAIKNFTSIKESTSKKIADMEKKIFDINKQLSDDLINAVSDFSTEEALDLHLKKFRRNLISYGYDLKKLKRDHQDYARQESDLDGVLKLKPADLSTFIAKNEWDPYLLFLLGGKRDLEDEQLQQLIRDTIPEIKGDKEALGAVNELREAGFLKEKFNAQEIMRRFSAVVNEVLSPLMRSFLMEEMIEYYPKISGTSGQEVLRFIAEEAVAGEVPMIEKDVRVTPRSEIPQTINIQKYKALVTVLNYDIRGSTFMGTKLQDAKRENEIRNLFQESMLTIVEKYGGIPIKDTGDGGIVLFASNTFEIKNEKTLNIEPGSVMNALRCGLSMTREAMNFVHENITRYKDWFQESEERKINFEGATFVTLPPSYQSIFQIGVGIASGEYPREVYLDRNAFGDFDLTGMLVREANFYSKVKAKEKSTVICDDSTVYNLLLNAERFSFLGDPGLRLDTLSQDVEQGLEYWMNQKVSRRGFIFDLYKIVVTKFGEEIFHPGSIKVLLGIDDIKIDETGEIKDGKGGRGKFIFEVSQEGI